MTDIAAQLTLWIEQLRAIAQTGLAFDPHTYDRERYDALLNLAAQMAATLNGQFEFDPASADKYARQWRADVARGVPGYVTPKVGVGAMVFNEKDEMLLIQRPEGGWLFPTGWADIGYSPAQVVVKEVREETGLDVTPLRLVGIYDSQTWNQVNPQLYSIIFYCRLDGGELRPHPVETRGAGFFGRAALPEPLIRATTDWVKHAWQVHHNDRVQAYFDL